MTQFSGFSLFSFLPINILKTVKYSNDLQEWRKKKGKVWMNVGDWSIGYFATDVAIVYSGLNIFEVGIILPFLLRLYRQWILIVSDELTPFRDIFRHEHIAVVGWFCAGVITKCLYPVKKLTSIRCCYQLQQTTGNS